MAIEKAVDEVQIARSAASRANGQLPGQVRFRSGCERRSFLMPYMQPLNIALADYIGQTVQTVANHAVDSLNSGVDERLDKNVRYFSGHTVPRIVD